MAATDPNQSFAFRLELSLCEPKSIVKKEFFILVDYGTGSTGYVVRANSREQINEIYDLPRSKWISVIEDGFEDHPTYQAQVSHSGAPLTYDVDAPEGSLEYYMERSGVIIPYSRISD